MAVAAGRVVNLNLRPWAEVVVMLLRELRRLAELLVLALWQLAVRLNPVLVPKAVVMQQPHLTLNSRLVELLP